MKISHFDVRTLHLAFHLHAIHQLILRAQGCYATPTSLSPTSIKDLGRIEIIIILRLSLPSPLLFAFTMRYALSLAALSAVANAALQLQSGNPGFGAAGIQGCISASENADGAPVVIHNCNTEDVAKHSWEVLLFTKFPAGPQQIKVFGDKCLDVKDGVIADGTKLQIWSCTEGNTNRLWTSLQDFTVQLSGTSKCIDLTDGNIPDGNQLQIWTCPAVRSDNQTLASNIIGPGDISVPILSLTAEDNADGAAVALAVRHHVTDTFPNGNETWILPQSPITGPIKTYGGSKCLDVKDGSDANGNLLQI
ncbi:hypothetical protein V5O48_006108 [Marasmius crinis-equi]|uniref:Ricin B lectin domain-containing protein n=1 Tax=Marasmius crinis-equi TaxID=585013 RepID=A0ABR3FKD1_9AGAR